MRVASLQAAIDVASRCTDRQRLETAIVHAREQTSFPRSVYWEACGIAQGDAGIALMCSYLDACFPRDGWDVTAHHFIASAASAAERAGYQHCGLFSGLSGLAFAAWCLSRGGSRYQKLLLTIEDSLLPRAIELAHRLVPVRPGMSFSEFDVISGLSGVAAYLLCRRDRPEAAAALREVLESLVRLTRANGSLPSWYTPVEFLVDETMVAMYPNGNLNCGLAHGIPGPLTVMALARQHDVDVSGLTEAIVTITDWLLAQRIEDPWGVNWPSAVPAGAGEDDRDTTFASVTSRAAWCYGSPGVIRALWQAGKALDDQPLCELAVAALEDVFRRPIAERRIDSPTFCHGVAGLLQITLRMANDTGTPSLVTAARDLSAQLLSAYDPGHVLGYYSLEPGGTQVDQPGLLDGAPGVALVLLAAATDVAPAWDRLFLLS
jgi:lantibiotic modifying enzyme